MPALNLQPWVVTEGSAGGADAFTDLAFNSAGQLLVAGYGGLGAPALGGSDLHLSLRDLRGRTIWQWNGGSSGDDAFLAVAPYGNDILAAGYIASAIGDRDAFVTRFRWPVEAGGPGPPTVQDAGNSVARLVLSSTTSTDDQFNDLAVTPAGEIVLVGVSRGDGSIGGQTKANAAPTGADRGLGDGLLTIIGNGPAVTRLIGGSGDDGLEAVAVVPSGTAAGTILVAGYRSASAGGDLQGYLASYDSAGTRRWEQSLGSATAADRLTAVQCDASTIYVAGTSRGLFPGGGSSRAASRTDADPIVAAFDLSGRQLWALQLDGSALEAINPQLALTGNRLELVYGDGSGVSRASISSGGQLLSTAALASASGGATSPEAVLSTSSGQLLVAGASSAAWPDRPAGGPDDAWLQVSGPGASAFQIDVSPLDGNGLPVSTAFSLDPGPGLKLVAGTYPGLTGRVTIDAAGSATYTPYPELPELQSWSSTLEDPIQLKLTDLAGQAAASQDLVLRVAPAASQPPAQRFSLNANQASGQVRPLALGRPELRLRLTDTHYTTSLGASRGLSAFSGDSADVSLRLAVDRAPLTALNALRYARELLYDSSIFHRVIDGFMVQGGGFSAAKANANGFGAIEGFAPIPLEDTLGSGLANLRGSIAMARTNNPNSASSQFFVNVVNNGFLDATAGSAADGSGNPGYAVFGAVANGLEVFDAIAKAPYRNGASGGNDSGWGAQGSGALFEDITEPVVVIQQARVATLPATLQYALVSQPATGSVSLDAATGAFRFNAAAGFNGRDSFEVRVTSPALAGLPARTVVERIEVSGSYGRASYSLEATPAGSRLSVSDPALRDVEVSSAGSPDLIEATTPLTLTLQARSSSTWGEGFAARNAGSPGSAGTGERLNLKGLARYSFVASAIPAATTAVNLEPDKDSAFFLHDAYSAFHADLSLSPDSSGRASTRRLLNVDTIRMGSAGGSSIVDLTSPDYGSGPVTVFGASRGTSVFWGSEADDTFISGGGDAVIFGGAGRNRYELGAGRDTLQLRAGATAEAVVQGFDPSRDRLQLWMATDQMAIEPLFTPGQGSTVISWAGNRLEFLGLPNLSLGDLAISQAVASL